MKTISRFVVLCTIMVVMFGALFAQEPSPEIILRDGLNGYAGTEDDTIYSDYPQNSFGAGGFLFTGQIAVREIEPRVRRALIKFDLSSVPKDTVVTTATLRLFVGDTVRGEDEPHALHRMLTPWNEGQAFHENPAQGMGVAAGPGDPTWTHSVFDTTEWNTPGGDYESNPSATGIVGDIFTISSFSSPQLAEDVRDMIANPETNYGWILIGNEEDLQVAKRIFSSEGPFVVRPMLIINESQPNQHWMIGGIIENVN